MVDGLICQYCEQDGFENRRELEAHIADHTFTEKRGCPRCGSKSWDAFTEECENCGPIHATYNDTTQTD